MSDYYGDATLEDWLQEEVFESPVPVPPEAVALFERYRTDVERNIEAWQESDDGYGNNLSWRGWGRGFDPVDDAFDAVYQQALPLVLTDLRGEGFVITGQGETDALICRKARCWLRLTGHLGKLDHELSTDGYTMVALAESLAPRE